MADSKTIIFHSCTKFYSMTTFLNDAKGTSMVKCANVGWAVHSEIYLHDPKKGGPGSLSSADISE